MNATALESESESGYASGGERRRRHPSKWSSAMRAWCSSASWCQRFWYSVSSSISSTKIQLIHYRFSYKFSCPDATSGHILCLPFDVLCVALCSAGHATQLQRICDCLLHHPADVEHAGPLGSHNATDSGGQPHAAHLQLLVQ